GNCAEVIFINGINNLTIQGTPAVPGVLDDSITGNAAAPPGAPSVVTVQQLTGFSLNDIRIVGFPGRSHAISLSRSEGSLRRCVVESAPLIGINISDNASIGMQDITAANNGGAAGIFVSGMSSASLGGTSEIYGNAGSGISVSSGSLLGGSGNIRVHNNGGLGITIFLSTIFIGGQSPAAPISIYDNGGPGLSLVSSKGDVRNLSISHNNLTGSRAPAEPSPLPGFFQCGLCLHIGSDLFVDTVQINESLGPAHGVVLRAKSGVTLRNFTITGSGSDGVHVEAGSGALFLTGTNSISGSGGANANCTDSLSWVGGDTTGVGKPIKCTVVK